MALIHAILAAMDTSIAFIRRLEVHDSPPARRYILYGASPRGAQSLALGGKAMVLRGREVVTAEDVRTVLVRSLQHRMILNFEGVASGIAPRDILANVVQVTEEPADVESPA
jgi:MoxR-like ATPase